MRLVFAVVLTALATALAQPCFAQNGSFYIGGTGGYGSGTSTHTGFVPPAPQPFVPPCCDDRDAKFNTNGGLIGGAVGWNIRYGVWLFGIESDYSYASVSGGSSGCGTVPNPCGSRLESLGTVRGRVGTLFNDWMLYGTGGFAFGKVSGFDALKTSGSETYSGWTIGGGIEKRFAPQWSMKLEYLYTDLGNKDLFQAAVPGFPENVAYKMSSVRLGISYYFEPAAAPARAPMITKGPALK